MVTSFASGLGAIVPFKALLHLPHGSATGFGYISVILRLAVLIKHRLVTDRREHDETTYFARIASHGNNLYGQLAEFMLHSFIRWSC